MISRHLGHTTTPPHTHTHTPAHTLPATLLLHTRTHTHAHTHTHAYTHTRILNALVRGLVRHPIPQNGTKTAQEANVVSYHRFQVFFLNSREVNVPLSPFCFCAFKSSLRSSLTGGLGLSGAAAALPDAPSVFEIGMFCEPALFCAMSYRHSAASCLIPTARFVSLGFA